MWLRVAINKDSVHYNKSISYSYIDGPNTEEYYFDQIVADALEKDGFLTEMWDKLDALFDWGTVTFSCQINAWFLSPGWKHVYKKKEILS